MNILAYVILYIVNEFGAGLFLAACGSTQIGRDAIKLWTDSSSKGHGRFQPFLIGSTLGA
jgi:hypothetical protein